MSYYPNVYASQTGPLALSTLDDNFNFAVDIQSQALYSTAGGTSDALTATYTPAVTALVSGLTLYVRAGFANTTTTPTFSPNGFTAATIVKTNNQPLKIGEIAGNGHVIILQYDGINSNWELLNPATIYANVAQIQPISASVAANALTISASLLNLDFRSTTLGSGTVTTVSGTPANLVISSGSTLGTVSAQQSRIVVIALNNAGTIELAAVNISGGNQLDETNLITTTAEGGAGAADSANVVYSATARTSLAYRVIGFIQSTQATAGTWATTPSTIQGSGGQALTAMSSLGYGQTWQSVTGSRTSNTTYYNTTGRPILVNIGKAQSGTNSSMTALVAGVSVCYLVSDTTNGLSTGCTSFIVPPGFSYSATTSSGFSFWSELR